MHRHRHKFYAPSTERVTSHTHTHCNYCSVSTMIVMTFEFSPSPTILPSLLTIPTVKLQTFTITAQNTAVLPSSPLLCHSNTVTVSITTYPPFRYNCSLKRLLVIKCYNCALQFQVQNSATVKSTSILRGVSAPDSSFMPPSALVTVFLASLSEMRLHSKKTIRNPDNYASSSRNISFIILHKQTFQNAQLTD